MALWGRSRASRNKGAEPARPSAVAVVDVGAAQTRCLIARRADNGSPEVLGIGRRPGAAKAGVITDLKTAAAAISGAVDDAGRAADMLVNRVVATSSGGKLAVARTHGLTPVARRVVSAADIRRALDQAMGAATPGRAVLHAVPLDWRLDDAPGVRDPEGLEGDMVGVDVAVITAAAGAAANLVSAVGRAGLSVRRLAAAPFAAGWEALTEDERTLGAVLIDLGAGLSTATVFLDGAPAALAATPAGASRVTADLACGLGAPLSEAERVKRDVGAVSRKALADVTMIPYDPGGYGEGPSRIMRSEIAMILQARVMEIFEHLRDGLADASAFAAGRRRIVITGGGARLDGVTEAAAAVFQGRARIVEPPRAVDPDDAVAGPDWAVCRGMAAFVLGGPTDAAPGADGRPVAVAEITASETGKTGMLGKSARTWKWLAGSF